MNDLPTLSDIESTIKAMNDILLSRLNRLEFIVENKVTPKYMTLKETAEYLRCSVQKVRGLINEGNLHSFKVGSGQTSKLILSRRDVDNYLRGTA